jgi:hypothetical protein
LNFEHRKKEEKIMANIQMSIPDWLDKLCAWPAMVYRKYRYGFTFRRIYMGGKDWTILDREDYYKFGNIKWALGGRKNNFYAIGGIRNKDGELEKVSLHRLILNPPENKLVDHRNGNGLDNRRENLRLATHAQNMLNRRKQKNTSSKFIGVYFDKQTGKWRAKIKVNSKTMHIGRFDSELQAALAYDRTAKLYHGEFSKFNFPKEIERSPKRLNLRLANWLGARLNFPEAVVEKS